MGFYRFRRSFRLLPERGTVATPSGNAGRGWLSVLLALAMFLGVWWTAFAITG